MISKKLQIYLEEYEESHKNKVNLMIHKICVPLIVFHFFAMFTWIPLFSIKSYPVTFAECAAFFVFCFYCSLDFFYAFLMLFYITACIFIGHVTPWPIVWTIAIVCWVAQLLGHGVWEKKSPSFSKNFVQLLIGPLFVLHILIIKLKNIYPSH